MVALISYAKLVIWALLKNLSLFKMQQATFGTSAATYELIVDHSFRQNSPILLGLFSSGRFLGLRKSQKLSWEVWTPTQDLLRLVTEDTSCAKLLELVFSVQLDFVWFCCLSHSFKSLRKISEKYSISFFLTLHFCLFPNFCEFHFLHFCISRKKIQ